MAIEPGNVVVLKSGGQPMTVAAVEENHIECIWLGEEGELFRESIPSVALSVVPDLADDEDLEVEDDDDEDEEDEDKDEDEERDEAGEDKEERPSKRKRRSA